MPSAFCSVCVRFRPVNNGQAQAPWEVDGNAVRMGGKSWVLDSVFGPGHATREVYAAVAGNLIEQARACWVPGAAANAAAGSWVEWACGLCTRLHHPTALPCLGAHRLAPFAPAQLREGFNATIFAYGQTGSGKTHTMTGPGNGGGGGAEGSSKGGGGSGAEGIIPLAVHDVFRLAEGDSDRHYDLTVTFMEVGLLWPPLKTRRRQALLSLWCLGI